MSWVFNVSFRIFYLFIYLFLLFLFGVQDRMLNDFVLDHCLFVNFTFTLKVPITTAADDIRKYVLIVFSEKIRLDISCESSDKWNIKPYFLRKIKLKKYIKVSSAAIFV